MGLFGGCEGVVWSVSCFGGWGCGVFHNGFVLHERSSWFGMRRAYCVLRGDRGKIVCVSTVGVGGSVCSEGCLDTCLRGYDKSWLAVVRGGCCVLGIARGQGVGWLRKWWRGREMCLCAGVSGYLPAQV